MAQREKLAIKRITSEFKKSTTEELYTIQYTEDNVFDCVVTLFGPKDTPYKQVSK